MINNFFVRFLKYFKVIFSSDLLLPLILVISYIAFLFIAKGIVPSGEEIVTSFASLYKKYGYEIIFVSAFLESLVLVNLFVPGQLAMALGAVFARSGETYLPFVILTASLGSISGYSLDFVLGYYGFSDFIKKMGYGGLLSETKKQLKRFGKRGLAFGFIHSNIGSFLSLAAGTINYEWKIFIGIAVLSTFVWATLWASAVYILGEVFIEIFKKYAIFLSLFVLLGMLAMRFWKKEK